jgi:hypothetical protein
MAPKTKMSEAEDIAQAIGIVVGAASNCDWATEERLSAAVDKMDAVVLATATDESDAETARRRFHDGFEAGKAAMESGEADSVAVEAAFDELELQLL